MQSANLKPLNVDQINKKILEKKPFVRPDYDVVNVTGNYQDQDYKAYHEKCTKFIEISKKYKEYNEQTFVTSKEKSLKDYENFIDEVSGDFFQVDKEEKESEAVPSFLDVIKSYDTNGKRERRRITREIHEELNTETNEYIIEPWFKRYLTLNKFIHITRAVILRNRLLKNLQILKQLHSEKISELEKNHLKCKNESYQEIFAKFL